MARTRRAVATTTSAPRWKLSDVLGRDARIGLAAIAVCCAVILVLRLVAKDAPSAGRSMVVTIPTPVVSTAAGCGNFAHFWIDESGVDVSVAMIEGISNCRQAADGSWFVPTGPDDPRLPKAAGLSPEQVAATADLRSELLAQIAALEAQFPATLQLWLKQMFDPFARAVTGNLRDGYSIRTARGRYTRLVQAYLMGPDREALADYVGWIMATRIRADDDLETACLSDPNLQYLQTACLSLDDNLSIRFPPFPWELGNPLLLDSYLASTVAEGDGASPTAGT